MVIEEGTLSITMTNEMLFEEQSIPTQLQWINYSKIKQERGCKL